MRLFFTILLFVMTPMIMQSKTEEEQINASFNKKNFILMDYHLFVT